jgi:hypothetical protein
MIKIIKNTYPKYNKAPHGEPGDACEWQLIKGAYCLIRESDKKCVYMTPPVNKEGLKQDGKPPQLTGVIAQVKSKGWILEVIND